MSALSPLRVSLVLHDYCRGWIIEKMALKLCDALRNRGVDAQVSSQPDPTAAVNHFMIFHYVEVAPGSLNTMAVTHVDDALKVDMIKRHLGSGVRAAVCMSMMTLDQLASYGVERRRLTYALPAHDGAPAPRRIVIGITSNCYSDGRKRDWLLTQLAADMRLDDFTFRFFGAGWDHVRSALEAAGAQVEIMPPTGDYVGDYSEIRAAIPHFDYYFYPGLDEGSMGTLDALGAGVRTIVTRQGFHLDLPHGITHGFWDYAELRSIFEEISGERRSRIETAAALTWDRYAQRHLEIWEALLERDRLPDADLLGGAPPQPPPAQYEIVGYRGILANQFRRQMALRFWTPRSYEAYLQARRRISRTLRGLGVVRS